MDRWILVRSKRLHGRRVITPEQTVERATLLPFFDREGRTQSFLLVDPASSELYLPRAAERIRVPLWGPIRIEDHLEILSDDNIEALLPYWHYDPWWMLKEPRYEDNQWAAILPATNCVGDFAPGVKGLLFSGNLLRVRWVTSKTTDGCRTDRFRSSMLPEYNRVRPRNVRTQRTGWQLAPFWESFQAETS